MLRDGWQDNIDFLNSEEKIFILTYTTFNWHHVMKQANQFLGYMAKLEKFYELHRDEYETWQSFIEYVNLEEFFNKEVLILEIENRPAD